MNVEEISRRSLIEELLFEVNEKQKYIELYDEWREKYRLLEIKYTLLMQQYQQILGSQFDKNTNLIQEPQLVDDKNSESKIKPMIKVSEFHTEKIKNEEEFPSNKKIEHHYVNLSERTQEHLKNKIKERQEEKLSVDIVKDPKKIYVNQLREEISALSNSLIGKNKLVISKEDHSNKEEKSLGQSLFKKDKKGEKSYQNRDEIFGEKVLVKEEQSHWVEIGEKNFSMKKKKSPYTEFEEEKKHGRELDKEANLMNEEDKKDESMIVKEKKGTFNDSMIAIIDQLGE